ncbi:heme ABC exporter ATP-binding protein CcmA [Oricola sp.]|uniref:heme ABC exporter ATP-binding protein CcmA n=1 Tax=Oricola sp. TaxID=1979950 RepID=UPI003BA84F07
MKLVVRDLAADRGAGPVFEQVSFTLAAGEGLLVTGPNGAGKSTLIRAIAGLLHPSAGKAYMENADGSKTKVAAASHLLGPINAMKPALTVRENLGFWQAFHGEPSASLNDAMELVGLEHTLDLPFSYLSTGQRRRVSIAKLLLNHRPVWLLDEPTSGLDAASEKQFATLIRDQLVGGGIVVAATHLPIKVAGMKSLTFGGALAA